MLLNWINGVAHTDPELTRRVYDCTQGGIDRLVARIEENGLNVPYRQEGCLELFTSAKRAEEAEAEVLKKNQWGIPLKWISKAELPRYVQASGAEGAILDPRTGHIHGLALVRAMKSKLEGVQFFENTPVLSIQEGKIIRLTTPLGEITAEALVLGTNGYTPRLGYFKHAICPMHSHVIATEPLSREQWQELGWGHTSGFSDDLDRIAYAGMTVDGSLLFGGGGNFAYGYRYNNGTSFPRDKADFQAIHQKLLHYLPRAKDIKITHRWSGTLGVTLDRSCSMGVRGEYRNVYYALGYSGHGITLANLAGEVLCDLYSGSAEKWANMPFFQRRLYPMPGEPLRWLGYHLVTLATGKSPRRR
jgi:glycine/D-amino acid oxidase-like deaminating enzyme